MAVERGVLAEAVAGAEARLDAEPLDGVEDHQARDERGELGVAGVLQLVGVGVEQQAGDVALGEVEASSTSSQLSWSTQGRPMPGRCEPWPGNVKASMRGRG